MNRFDLKTVAQNGKGKRNRNRHFTTKVAKSTKLRSSKISIFQSFVSFVRFVVKSGFLSHGSAA